MDRLSKKVQLLQNLEDAGCNADLIKQYLKLQQTGKRQEQIHLLSMHRVALLDELHRSQHKIDCLDYLIYTLKKEQI